jgi:hypothetical protein
MPDQHDDTDPDRETELTPQGGSHEAPEGAPVHPLIDLSRDPNPGRPDHARPEND